VISEIKFNNERVTDFQKILALYDNAGWTAYTSDPETLQQAINNSLYLLTAWSGQQLVGLLRAVRDGLTIIYIQDIIVLDSFRRQGIGKELLHRTLKNYENVRQILLLTDEQPDTISFYESVGLQQANKLQLTSFIQLNTNDNSEQTT
jgi:GNAT superfamily N-acetyltransferase